MLFKDLLSHIMIFWFPDMDILHYCSDVIPLIAVEIMSNWCLEFQSLSLQTYAVTPGSQILLFFAHFPSKGRATPKWPKLDFVTFLVPYCFGLIRQSRLKTIVSDIVFNVLTSLALTQAGLPQKLLYGCLSNSFKWDSIINDLRRKSLTLFID